MVSGLSVSKTKLVGRGRGRRKLQRLVWSTIRFRANRSRASGGIKNYMCVFDNKGMAIMRLLNETRPLCRAAGARFGETLSAC